MDEETRKNLRPFLYDEVPGPRLGAGSGGGHYPRASGGGSAPDRAGQRHYVSRVPSGGPSPEIQRREAGQPDVCGTATVLLADDEAMVRDFGRAALERFGYRVLTANDGREAVRLSEENADEIKLVLVDLAMPVMGGHEVIGALKSRCARLRIIVMSGYSESEVLETFAGKGVSGFLHKPFTATRLAEEVEAVLAGPAETPAIGA